jgi:hypothetical protein
MFVANAARGVAQVLQATMVAAGSGKRRQHRVKIQSDCCPHSDIIASRATATVELSSAVCANVQRRHQPQQRLMTRARLRANRKAPIAPFKTVARTTSALKSRHFSLSRGFMLSCRLIYWIAPPEH